MTNSGPSRLGGPLAPRREVHFFWLLDGSTSMVHEYRIRSLNFAVNSAIREMKRVAQTGQWKGNVLVRALRFASDVEWVVKEPTPVAELRWTDIYADGETAMGKALSAVADELEKLDARGKYYPPVIILVTDGEPTDRDLFDRGLQRLLNNQLGRVSTRIAVPIKVGRRGTECLKRFSDIILPAERADEIVQNIVIASTSGIMISAKPGQAPELLGAGGNR